MKWNDIKKQEPPCAGSYLVTDGEDIQIMDYFGKYKGADEWSSRVCCTLDVTHWMELPELPND